MAKSGRVTKTHQRAPDAGDAAVGPRLREARLRLKMSQEELAGKVGITFQQIQKYEKGKNRVSIGRLSKIADNLAVSTTFLLTGKEERRGERGVDEGGDLLKMPGALRLIEAFDRIQNREARQALVHLAESAAKKR